MFKKRRRGLGEQGGAVVEFAILLPVWFLLLFGFLDYGWYLVHLMVLENAACEGARAGVKVKYWLDPDDDDYQDPRQVAKNKILNAFWIDDSLTGNQIDAIVKDRNDETVDESDTESAFNYLEIRISQFSYTPLVGYVPDSWLPKTISAYAMAAFP